MLTGFLVYKIIIYLFGKKRKWLIDRGCLEPSISRQPLLTYLLNGKYPYFMDFRYDFSIPAKAVSDIQNLESPSLNPQAVPVQLNIDLIH